MVYDQTFRNTSGLLHREDGPAVIRPSGTEEWYLNGKRHRVDGPAYTRPGGTKGWYLNNKLHRTDGPAIVDAYGNEEWYLDGEPVDPLVHLVMTYDHCPDLS